LTANYKNFVEISGYSALIFEIFVQNLKIFIEILYGNRSILLPASCRLYHLIASAGKFTDILRAKLNRKIINNFSILVRCQFTVSAVFWD